MTRGYCFLTRSKSAQPESLSTCDGLNNSGTDSKSSSEQDCTTKNNVHKNEEPVIPKVLTASTSLTMKLTSANPVKKERKKGKTPTEKKDAPPAPGGQEHDDTFGILLETDDESSLTDYAYLFGSSDDEDSGEEEPETPCKGKGQTKIPNVQAIKTVVSPKTPAKRAREDDEECYTPRKNPLTTYRMLSQAFDMSPRRGSASKPSASKLPASKPSASKPYYGCYADGQQEDLDFGLSP